MPVARQEGFSVATDVNASERKGVTKRGYLSTSAHSTLSIGPIASNVSCALFEVSLGFLTSWRSSMGAFDVSCDGCVCKRIQGAWAVAGLSAEQAVRR